MPSDILSTPIRIGHQLAANRVAMAPMTNEQSFENGVLSDAEIAWLAMRARGEFGLFITDAWAVAPEGRTWPGQVALYAPGNDEPLAKLGRAIAATGSRGMVQIFHCGSRATPEITQAEGISASAGDAWRAASDADIRDLIDAHVTAALRVQSVRLAGVEIHSAHGFLPAQFINRVGNTRTDSWGGDLNGRSRFLRELVGAIRNATGPNLVIGVRRVHRHAYEGHERTFVLSADAEGLPEIRRVYMGGVMRTELSAAQEARRPKRSADGEPGSAE